MGARAPRRSRSVPTAGPRSPRRNLADALLQQGRDDEAEPIIVQGRRWAIDDRSKQSDLSVHVVAGRLTAHRGEVEEAERLGAEAVTRAAQADLLHLSCDAYRDLAEVLELGDKPEEARAALEQALALYERKDNVVMAERVRGRLETV